MKRYAQQYIDESDILAVTQALKSDFLTCGPLVESFEKSIAEYTGAKYAVAVSNATAGLHLACLALNLQPSDYLWTSPNTFVASANCALYCGAKVDFIDIELDTYNLSCTELEKKLLQASANNSLPKVVVAVHFAGHPCDMKKLHQLAKTYGFYLIEDASHAIGGQYDQQPIGNCQYSDFSIFSFHPVKIMTSGEGGVVLTNNKDLYEKVKLLRSHGVTRDRAALERPDEGPWYYEMNELGFNYRITELQCALGLSQLQKVDQFVKRRHELARYYDEHLQSLPLKTPFRHPDSYSALHLYPILIEQNKTRKQVFLELQAKSIGVNVHYIPVPMQPFYRRMGFKVENYPNALAYYQKTISLPLYYGLTESEQDYVIHSLREILL